MKIKMKEVVMYTTMFLLFLLVIWMMFQPLMSSYSDGALEIGAIYVYGVSFLNEFGAQGVLTVAFPFLLMLVAILDVEEYRKVWLCGVLTFVSLLAYARSLAFAKLWLCTEVSWGIKYYSGIVMYPVLMVAFMVAVIIWVKKYDADEVDEEEEEEV